MESMDARQTGADTVKEIMTHWVKTIASSDSLLQARDAMNENHTSQLVVVDHRQRGIGIISKRDIARFLLEDQTDRDIEKILVSEASSKSLFTVRSDLAVVNAARLFDTDNVSFAVVTNENPLIGIITETDLCHYFSQRSLGRFEVKDFMQSDFIFAKTTYPVVHVAHAIVFRQPSVPVIDEELVGILTLSDVLSVKERIPQAKNGWLGRHDANNAAFIATKDVMTRNPVVTREDTDLAQAGQLIISKGVSSLPVVDHNSKVVGLLAKHDIVKALGRFDGSIVLEAKGH